MSKLPVSIIMLTLNEQEHLPEVLDNILPWAQGVFILDSLSTDRTVDIALAHGVTVVQCPFTNFADQWNWALDHFDVQTPWTMKLDPDERVSSAFVEELAQLFREGPRHGAYMFQRRLWFMGRPLNQLEWVVRIWRTGQAHFSSVLVNEHPIMTTPVAQLKQPLEHLDTRNLHDWFAKQNLYTTMGAIEQARGMRDADQPRLFGNRLQRQMFLKRLFYRTPFRFALLWLYLGVYKRALLCGRAGLVWVNLRVSVFRWIEMKRDEMRYTGIIPEVPKAPHGDFDPRVVQSPAHIRAWQRDQTPAPGTPVAPRIAPGSDVTAGRSDTMAS
jgi:glycosyltransferase involved in cell wall biosynthesis